MIVLFQPIEGTVTIDGDKKTFVPNDPSKIDKSTLPLHGLFVICTLAHLCYCYNFGINTVCYMMKKLNMKASHDDVIPSEFGFLQPTVAQGGPSDFTKDPPGTVLCRLTVK